VRGSNRGSGKRVVFFSKMPRPAVGPTQPAVGIEGTAAGG